MSLNLQKQSVLKFFRRIIQYLNAIGNYPKSEAIVTLAESEWNEARSARGIVRPKLYKHSEMKFIGQTILHPKTVRTIPPT
jgi:hypothetical protein